MRDRLGIDVELDRSHAHAITVITRRGAQQVFASATLGGGWIVLDLLLTGQIGIIVDAVTSAWSSVDIVAVP